MRPFDEVALSRDEYQRGWLEAYERVGSGDLWDTRPVDFLPAYASILRDNDAHSILEAGCGDGRNAIYLLQQGFLVIGADISPLALNGALAAARQLGLRDGCFVTADLEMLPKPFAEHGFDALTCLDVFGQLLKIDQAVAGFLRVVRPGGLLLINLYTPEDASYGVGEQLGERTFLYNNTLFRFFTEQDISATFSNFDILRMERRRWLDPPHPGFRDDYHTHDSFVVLLRTPTA